MTLFQKSLNQILPIYLNAFSYMPNSNLAMKTWNIKMFKNTYIFIFFKLNLLYALLKPASVGLTL